MSTEQIILFAILIAVFGFLIWGRWRYDLVAFTALVVALLTGVVPAHDAFSGFGHPATVIVALVAWRLTKAFIKPPAPGETPATKKCQYCKMEIDAEAVRCAHCTSELRAA